MNKSKTTVTITDYFNTLQVTEILSDSKSLELYRFQFKQRVILCTRNNMNNLGGKTGNNKAN